MRWRPRTVRNDEQLDAANALRVVYPEGQDHPPSPPLGDHSSVIFMPSGAALTSRPWLVQWSVIRTPLPFFMLVIPLPPPRAPPASMAVYVPSKSFSCFRSYTSPLVFNDAATT